VLYSRKIPANLTSNRLKGSVIETRKASRGRGQRKGIRKGNEIVLLMKQTPILSSGKEMLDAGNRCVGNLRLPQSKGGGLTGFMRMKLMIVRSNCLIMNCMQNIKS